MPAKRWNGPIRALTLGKDGNVEDSAEAIIHAISFRVPYSIAATGENAKTVGVRLDNTVTVGSGKTELIGRRKKVTKGAERNMGGETEKEILKILEDAISREQSAYRLYSRGESLAEKGELKDIFAMLAREELGHEKLLKQVHHDYKKKLGLKLLKEEDDE